MTRRQVHGAVVAEALTATLIGLFLGALAAVTALIGLWIATWRAYETPTVAVPWPLLLGITALTITLTTGTAILSTRITLRVNPIHAMGTPQ